MSYTPNTWETGDTITAAKLNNMEQGIANADGGTLIVTVERAQDGVNYALDKSWTEIHDAILSRGVTIIKHETGEDEEDITNITFLYLHYDSVEGYVVGAGDEDYIASTANDYPQTDRYNEG